MTERRSSGTSVSPSEERHRERQTAEAPQTRSQTQSLSQGQLIWRRFKRHRIGAIGAYVIILLILLAVFAGFIAPYHPGTVQRRWAGAPPTRVHFSQDGQLAWPYVHGLKRTRDPETFETIYLEDESTAYPIKFFVRGDSYAFMGLFETDLHLFGTGEPLDSPGQLFVFGTDTHGRDLLSRILIGGRVTLAIGPIVVLISTLVGALFGGLSGYFGSWIDMVVQRFIEIWISIPTLPLYLTLGAVIPAGAPNWFRLVGIIVILSVGAWAGLARVVRGMVLSLREEEFTLAARAMGSSSSRVIVRHLLPNTLSYLIVQATVAIPGLIIAESTLSFLGFGVKEPMTSWGELLNDAQEWSALSSNPWLMIPGAFILVTVLAFNFVGDALRDAVDPFSHTGR